MIKGVQKVRPIGVDSEDWMNRERVRHELKRELWEALEEEEG